MRQVIDAGSSIKAGCWRIVRSVVGAKKPQVPDSTVAITVRKVTRTGSESAQDTPRKATNYP